MTNYGFAGGWDGDNTPAQPVGGGMHTFDTDGRTLTEREMKRLAATNKALARTHVIKAVPQSAQEYEERVAECIEVAERLGYTATRVAGEPVVSGSWGMHTQQGYSERLVINSDTANLYNDQCHLVK